METLKIDARGRSCPEPLLLVKKGMESHSNVQILVDNKVAVENIQRFAKNAQFQIEVVPEGDEYRIDVAKKG